VRNGIVSLSYKKSYPQASAKKEIGQINFRRGYSQAVDKTIHKRNGRLFGPTHIYWKITCPQAAKIARLAVENRRKGKTGPFPQNHCKTLIFKL
jgi:hypothetical protein